VILGDIHSAAFPGQENVGAPSDLRIGSSIGNRMLAITIHYRCHTAAALVVCGQGPG
jgi:hypothetical protein